MAQPVNDTLVKRTNPALIVLLAIFIALAVLYSVVVPIFDASDEFWHYPMVAWLADGNRLPVQDPENPGPWKQEGSQPPLYYYLGAELTFWVDTSDMPETRRENPHVDNGLITEDGNINLVVHNAAEEAWPWQGTTLAVHIVRLLSVALSAGTIYFTYRIGAEIFEGERRWLALAGAAAVAFTPMFVFVSGAVNNDNLSSLLAAAGLWVMLRIIRAAREDQPTLRWSIPLGIVLGLLALTKLGALAMFGLAGLTMAYAAWRRKRWQVFFLEGPLIIGLAVAISGWWYWRNWQLYGDFSGLNVFIAILGQRERPASLRQLWGERIGFMQSYWGLFGGVNVPMPYWVYHALNILAIASALGMAVFLIQKARRDGLALDRWAAMLLTLLLPVSVIAPLALWWARVTWSSQGRLVFSAISVLGLLFAAGLGAALPRRVGKAVVGITLTFMATLTALAPILWIAPVYQPPEQLAVPADGGTTLGVGDAPQMRLVAYDVASEEIRPGEALGVTLTWEVVGEMTRDWSVFLHLTDPNDIIVAQRDTYPGVGLLATSDLAVGRSWTDHYVIPIPETTYAPEEVRLLVGLYDYETWERMAVIGEGVDAVTLATVEIVGDPDSEVPNPVSFNFGNEMMLRGYQMDRRQALAGETLTLTLYWQGLRPMGHNYTVFAHVLGPETRLYGQEDSWPLDGAYPTTAWNPGETVEDTYLLILAEDTPPGVYDIEVGVYWVDDEGHIERLQRVTEDGRLVEDYVLLTRIRVNE
jgi:4-amino-4-deoxy-L-arabinose transferase-like glycosyltransferase